MAYSDDLRKLVLAAVVRQAEVRDKAKAKDAAIAELEAAKQRLREANIAMLSVARTTQKQSGERLLLIGDEAFLVDLNGMASDECVRKLALEKGKDNG